MLETILNVNEFDIKKENDFEIDFMRSEKGSFFTYSNQSKIPKGYWSKENLINLLSDN